ncbi:MAG: molecular chaperone HtpG [Methylococcales bacterium]|nr:molecular chaperone HtpG [Methylococcales bacterium]
MSAEIKNTQVNLSGLLEVLGKNLYSTPLVAIRELIQNAHDACVRRQIESPDDTAFHIHITPLASQQQLIIEDNGAGLTKEEIEKYLATIGSGYTRELRTQSDNEDMIGFFGLGFLSAYVVSDKVTLTTTSYQDPSQGWQFNSSGGMNYSLSATDANPTGSKVTLQLTDKYAELTNIGLLEDVIRQYCCLLTIPISINRQATPINQVDVPWLMPEHTSPIQRKARSLAFAQIFEQRYEPLTSFAITPTDTCDINGLLWIQGGSSYANSDQRNCTVFVRNMYITQETSALLPAWAGFIGCVINTTMLTPTASREDIQQDSAFTKIKQHIETTLINALAHLSSTEPEAWKRVLSRHNEMLLGAAVSSETLFSALHEELTVPTTEGDLTLKALVNNGSNTIHVTLDDSGSYDEILCRAMQIPIVLGYRFASYPFCQMYAGLKHHKLVTLGTDAGNKALFSPVEDAPLAAQLEPLFIEAHEALVLTEFEPTYLPLLIIPDEEVARKRKIESDDAQKRISTAALSLATLYTQKVEDTIRRRVYININAPLIQSLINQPSEKQHNMAILLKSFACSIGRINLDTDERSLSDELQRYHDNLLTLFQG